MNMVTASVMCSAVGLAQAILTCVCGLVYLRSGHGDTSDAFGWTALRANPRPPQG